MTFIALAGFLFAVSYSREVAPLMAFRCARCHGDQGAAGQLDTRSWAGLRQAVTPGNPDTSALIEYVEGRRGPLHRMPLGEPPLDPREIAMLRQWVAEGAAEDADKSTRYELSIERVSFPRGKRVRVAVRSPEKAYLRVELADPRDGRVLHTEAVAGTSGSWDLARERNWPRAVDVKLQIAYAARRPSGAELCVDGRPCAVLSNPASP
jgi:cytochrome c553